MENYSEVEVSALGAYKYSTTTQTHSITDHSNQAWAFRAMDDATMRNANPWLYTDPDNTNSLPVSVLPVGGFYRETKYGMSSYDFRATMTYNDVYKDDHILNVFGGMERGEAHTTVFKIKKLGCFCHFKIKNFCNQLNFKHFSFFIIYITSWHAIFIIEPSHRQI